MSILLMPFPTQEILLDEENYPTEKWLHYLRTVRLSPDGVMFFFRTFFQDGFPQPYGKISIRWLSKGKHRVTLITGGWSGCEDIVDAMLQNITFSAWYVKWERGGRLTFEVKV